MTCSRKLLSLILFLLSFHVMGQQDDPEYVKVTLNRAEKIVEKLPFENQEDREKVVQIIAKQYRELSKLHDQQEKRSEELKEKFQGKPNKSEKSVSRLSKKFDKEINQLKESFLSKLGETLDEDQLAEVKDGLTYHVAPNTYQVYQDMLPNLTAEQKKFILDNLLEAREHAMMAGSSKDKHAWFGKFKGRINNYLSQEGYDLKKASEAMEARIGKN